MTAFAYDCIVITDGFIAERRIADEMITHSGGERVVMVRQLQPGAYRQRAACSHETAGGDGGAAAAC
jgi:hypothetical protein